MDKTVITGQEVRKKLTEGVKNLVQPVKMTLGAKGRLVGIFDSLKGLHVTKDGYTIAKNYKEDGDKARAVAIEMTQQAINNTNSTVGDATTTTAIMCEVLIEKGLRLVDQGVNPLKIKEGMDKGLAFVKDKIEKMSIPVKDKIEKIATISGNNRSDIGAFIKRAFDVAGKHENSSIKVFETTDEVTTVEEVNGYKIEKGFLRDSFINHPSRTKCVYKNPYILTVHSELSSFRDFLPLLQQVAQKQRPLVIIADKFKGEFMNALEVTMADQINRLQQAGGNGYFQHIGLIQNPMAFQSAKEVYDDIAVVTGNKTSSLKVQINDIEVDNLGEAESVEITRTSSLIIGGKGSQKKIDEKIKELKAQLDNEKDLTDFMRGVIRERIESLSGSHANIRVGGKNPSEMKELKDLYDDALNAVRAAIKEGIVPGGGSTLLRVANMMKKNRRISDEEVRKGWELIIDAIEAPFYQVMENAREKEPKDIAREVLASKQRMGYDVLRREVVDMIDEGIIDPAMAERVALENSVAVASMMHNMDALLLEDIG